MLNRLTVRGFKSLADVTVEFPRLAVLFGFNSGGKSNLLEAIQALSRIGTESTFADALDEGVLRSHAFEMFHSPDSGSESFESRSPDRFSIEADLTTPEAGEREGRYRYGAVVEIDYRYGKLANRGEFLSALTSTGKPKGKPAIEVADDGRLRVRRQRGGRPLTQPLGRNFTVLSDPRFAAPDHLHVDRVRSELRDWSAHRLDPRTAMRAVLPPMPVHDIGASGEHITPFLHRLEREHPKHFAAVARTAQAFIPSVDAVHARPTADGLLHLLMVQHGAERSLRTVSDGTLRLLGLCAIAVSPWGGSLLTFEEPDNGVDPRWIGMIASILTMLALDQGLQVIVTTHSPLFCDAVLREARDRSTDEIGVFNVRQTDGETVVDRVQHLDVLLEESAVRESLALPADFNPFECLMLRGIFDE